MISMSLYIFYVKYKDVVINHLYGIIRGYLTTMRNNNEKE